MELKVMVGFAQSMSFLIVHLHHPRHFLGISDLLLVPSPSYP